MFKNSAAAIATNHPNTESQDPSALEQAQLVLALELPGLSKGTPNILELVASEAELKHNTHYKVFEIVQEDLGVGEKEEHATYEGPLSDEDDAKDSQ
jgi:hypothetical protein